MSKKKEKIKREDRPAAERWKTVSLTGGFAVWAVVWFIGLLSTQLLRSSASNIFFRFVCALPILSLLYALIGRSALKVFLTSTAVTVEKNAPMTYEFRIYNESVLPYPFVDAYLALPQNNCVRCAERRVRLSVPPSSDYNVQNTVRFRFRGTYEIGVSCFYVYDFFRMFRIKVPEESRETVYVLPRKLMMNADTGRNPSDSVQQVRKSSISYEKIEVSDIRDYRPGDPIKSIHWKLSSKGENTIIREYNTGTADVTYLFADLSARFPKTAPMRPFRYDPAPLPDDEDLPAGENAAEQAENAPEKAAAPAGEKEASRAAGKKKKRGEAADAAAENDVHDLISDSAYEDMNEYCADGVVELTVAAALRELRLGRRVHLMWFDARSEIGAYSFELHSAAEFDAVFELFATAPLAPAEKTVARLCAMISDSEDAKYMFVLPAIDDETVASLCTMPCLSGSSSTENEAVVYVAEERYAHPAKRAAYLESCTARLAESGLTLVKGSLEGFSEIPSDSDKRAEGGKGHV